MLRMETDAESAERANVVLCAVDRVVVPDAVGEDHDRGRCAAHETVLVPFQDTALECTGHASNVAAGTDAEVASWKEMPRAGWTNEVRTAATELRNRGGSAWWCLGLWQ